MAAVEHAADRVRVQTGARLHFGLLPNRTPAGRQFGGIGVMITDPGWTVSVERAAIDSIEVQTAAAMANPDGARRAAQFLHRYREQRSLAPSAVRVEIASAIPGHQGLGSGTQLGLALAKALALLEGADTTSVELARRVGRGKRSAIGIWGFDEGGFLFDAGKLPPEDIGVLAGRFTVPMTWRFVLVSPLAQAGLSGAEELAAFSRLPPMSEDTTLQLLELITSHVLPSLVREDFPHFADSLFEYGRIVGMHFSAAQGGVFAAPLMMRLADELARFGHGRPVQTSWGPTCAVPCRSADDAARVQAAIASLLPKNVIETRIVAAQ